MHLTRFLKIVDMFLRIHNFGPVNRAMSLSFQSSILVASPSYPNSVAWSEENLVAVASGHIVTILVHFLLTTVPFL